MIKLDCAQGSQEWIDARLGIPTASAFSRLITPKTRKPSAGAQKYMHELLAEWLTGYSMDDATSSFMERGRDMEIDAVQYYELLNDVDTEEVGFCLSDDGKYGASPDRLVGDDGGLEIKCLSAPNHIAALLTLGKSPEKNDYYAQVQGSLWVTGRQWWDFICYHPSIQSVVVRYERDTEFIAQLAKIVDEFTDRLEVEKRHLISIGCQPAGARDAD